MARKRLTEIFPFILPLRVWQKNLFYKINMALDKNKYCKTTGDLLKYEVCNTKTTMVNEQSGHDIIYQKNKVHNLKIASSPMNQILIQPGETFSFYYLTRKAKKYGKYKDGLIVKNGKVSPEKGGGICQLSNMLNYLFLLTPLTITERHGHTEKSFLNPDKDALDGIDATVCDGWLDLKVKNETSDTYQVSITFDDIYMYGQILSSKKPEVFYEITNENVRYKKENNKIYEYLDVYKITKSKKDNKELKKDKLYSEKVLIGYKLPENIEVEEN